MNSLDFYLFHYILCYTIDQKIPLTKKEQEALKCDPNKLLWEMNSASEIKFLFGPINHLYSAVYY